MLPCGAGGPIEDLEGILGSWARQARERIGNSARPLALVWELLRERLRKAARPDAAIVDCIASIERARGAGAMDRFRPAGLSLRQWQRRFLDSTGFTPKSFARIVRLQGVLANHEANPRRPWSELALDAGYFDQSHLIPEFRSFTGSSPERFFAARPALEDFYLDFPDDAFLQDAHWR
jgi:AraC-like DNA-binding protein